MKQKIAIIFGIALLLALSFWVAVYHYGPPRDLIEMPYTRLSVISPDGTVEISRIKVEENGQVRAWVKNTSDARQVISFHCRIEWHDHMNIHELDYSVFYDPGEEKENALPLPTFGHGYYIVTLSAGQYNQNGMTVFWSETINFKR